MLYSRAPVTARRGSVGFMRIATRLVLILGIAVTAIVAAYALITLRQREAMLKAALIRETETLAWALNGAAANAAEDQRFADLDAVFQHTVRGSETFASVLLDADGRTLAGGADADPECLRDLLPAARTVSEEISGWIECEGPVRWVISPVGSAGMAVLLARRANLVQQDIASSRRRHLVLTLALVATVALLIYLVLGRTLSAPLAEIMCGVRAVGSTGSPRPIQVPESAGELTDLAGAFNHMAERLEEGRLALVAENEGRLALERRLRDAEKFAALGRLTGGVAHELGSPLNVIAMRAETISSAPSAPPPVRHQAEQIVAEVDRIAELIRGLLHVSRRHGVNAQSLNLSEVVDAALLEVREEASASNIDIDVDQPDTPVSIYGDATLLRHALLNLVRNAIYALKAHPGRRNISVRLQPGDAQARITVTDTGPGIAAEALEHIFEPFFTTKDVGEGTGLGLAISRGIVEEHGGHLELRPGNEGVGVCATMILPIDGPASTGMVL